MRKRKNNMDRLVRYISEDGTFYIIAADTAETVRRAHEIHGTSPLCSAALGRLLTAGALMSSMLKNDEDSITLRVNGGGPCGTVLAVAEGDGTVRGYIDSPHIVLPLKGPGKLDVGSGVGKNGSLTVIKDIGLKDPYVGASELVSGEIAEDVTAYYACSEQIPTVCALGVLADPESEQVITAGGFLIQLLPTAGDDTAAALEAAAAHTRPVTSMQKDGLDPDAIVAEVLAGFDIGKLGESEISYRCTCSKDRVSKALISLGKEQLLEMAEDAETEVSCQFCDKKYVFSSDEIRELIS
jgi:molecular chaperone Hsp33